MAKYAAAVDQGTTSTRFMVFDHEGKVVCYDQKEHEQIYPKPGWVEHSPDEIWERTQTVIKAGLAKGNIDPKDIAAVGITNQRETAVVWDKTTGKPLYNAIRTMLMDLKTLDWDDEILKVMTIPRSMLPQIRSCSEVYGQAVGDLAGIPIAGILGDQQAATVGQTCFSAGEAKNTYGTGCFMLLNTGTEIVPSKNGLLTTLCYKMGDAKAVYALEGSIAITGALVQWLRDNLGMITS